MIKPKTVWSRYGFAWITLAFFVLSLAGHWTAGWFAYLQAQEEHGQPPEVRSYVIEMTRDTLENWQSEFLQLLWQVGGLAFLLYIGSPQSKEGDDRKEEKLDQLLKALVKDGDAVIKQLDRKYPRE